MCHALAPSISSHGLLVFVVLIYFMDHYQARYELVWHSDLIYFMLVWVSLFSNQSLTFLFTALQALNCFKDKIKMYIYYESQDIQTALHFPSYTLSPIRKVQIPKLTDEVKIKSSGN